MEISLEDVRQALVELGRLRFGEMSLEDAIGEVVQTTHSMFDRSEEHTSELQSPC